MCWGSARIDVARILIFSQGTLAVWGTLGEPTAREAAGRAFQIGLFLVQNCIDICKWDWNILDRFNTSTPTVNIAVAIV